MRFGHGHGVGVCHPARWLPLCCTWVVGMSAVAPSSDAQHKPATSAKKHNQKQSSLVGSTLSYVKTIIPTPEASLPNKGGWEGNDGSRIKKGGAIGEPMARSVRNEKYLPGRALLARICSTHTACAVVPYNLYALRELPDIQTRSV
eukprot:3703081-Rhodomonas_salina.2